MYVRLGMVLLCAASVKVCLVQQSVATNMACSAQEGASSNSPPSGGGPATAHHRLQTLHHLQAPGHRCTINCISQHPAPHREVYHRRYQSISCCTTPQKVPEQSVAVPLHRRYQSTSAVPVTTTGNLQKVQLTSAPRAL